MAASSGYTHKVLTIKCCIESKTLKKTQYNVKWDKNIKSLLNKITKKFKFLKNMEDAEWSICIDGKIIDKQNAEQLKQVLQAIPPNPIPVVEIVKIESSPNGYVITIHYGDKEFNYKITADIKDWNEDIYQDLFKAIGKEFNLESDFGLIDADKIDIDDIDDLSGVFDDEDDPNKTQVHLFIQQHNNENKFKIIFEDKSFFFWIPPNQENDDEKEWEENYNALLNQISQKHDISVDEIELQQHQDGADIDVESDELKEIWQELSADENVHVAVIKIASDQTIAPDEPGQANQSLKSWFDDVLNLPQYYEAFVQAGYQDLNYLDVNINEDELINDIGIKKKPHRRKILAEIQILMKNNTQQNDDNDAKLDFEAKTVEPTTIGEGISDTTQSIAFKNWVVDTLQLQQYYQLFIKAGYDDLNSLNENITEDDLIKYMGIKKKPHRKKILSAIDTLVKERAKKQAQKTADDEKSDTSTPNSEDEGNDPMKSWFKNVVKLPQYYQPFVEAGYEDMTYLDEEITGDDLKELGIKKKPHRKKILMEIKQLIVKNIETETKQPVAITDEMKDDEKQSEPTITSTTNEQTNTDSKFDDVDDDEEKKNNIVKIDIAKQLIDLGSNVGTLDNTKKKLCYGTLVHILEEAKKDQDRSRVLEKILAPVSKNESNKFTQCIASFLQIIGYNVIQSNEGFEIKGSPNQESLSEIIQNFYHLSNAMMKPRQNIYQQLHITIPDESKVVKHDSGIHDDTFIIFQLPQILLENQQSSLVNKVTLDPYHLERFINFLAPNCSKHSCKEIYFEKLSSFKVAPIGLFGSRKEILSMLIQYKAISKLLYDNLLHDETNTTLMPGIHAILPIDLQINDNINKWDHVIYLFYWSLPNSFDMCKMKEVRKMRKDPACLLSRVLYEISSTVSIQVTSNELNDFGVIQKNDQQIGKFGKSSRKNLKRVARVRFGIEETKENHIMCMKRETLQKKLSKYSSARDDNACESFLLGGNYMNGYCQLYQQPERIINELRTWKGSTQNEIIDKLKELNDEYVISWNKNFSYKAKCILAQAIAPKQFAMFNCELKKLSDAQDEEKDMTKIKKQVDDILNERQAYILQDFFNLYDTHKYCARFHVVIKQIFKELGNDIPYDLALNATKYATMQNDKNYANDDFQGSQDYYTKHYKKECLDEITKKLKNIIGNHKKKMQSIEISKKCDINAANTFEQKELKKIKDENDDSLWNKTKNVVHKVGEALNVVDEEKVLSKDEIETQKQKKMQKAAKDAKQDKRYQRNQTIRQWIKLFESSLASYTNKIYQPYQHGSKINRSSVQQEIQNKIQNKYVKLRNNLKQQLYNDFKATQSSKASDMLTTILSDLKIKDATSYRCGEFELYHFVPKTIPPTYGMEFVSIDLANIADEMKTQTMKNMQYEMKQNDKLMLHHVMDNGDTIMVISSQMEETKSNYTDIVVSIRRTLTYGQKIKRLKRNIQLVAYCESQNLFAILGDNRLAFAVLQEGIRVTFTNKASDLRDLHWYNKLKSQNKGFKVMLMHEVDKNVFIWLIDENNIVRAYDYDANSWDNAKEFKLDQTYDSYLLSPTGSFLVAFKPQYEQDDKMTPGQDSDDDSSSDSEQEQKKDESKEDEPKPDESETEKKEQPKEQQVKHENKMDEQEQKQPSKRTPTGRIQLHAWILSEKRKLKYKIHKKSLTGYEMGDEQEMNDENKDELDSADNVLLPETFSIKTIQLNQLQIQETTKKTSILLGGITTDLQLLYHPLEVQVSDSKLKINKQKKISGKRRITKLDYMEYMVEKFGSRAAICAPEAAVLNLHTTYLLQDECKAGENLCGQIAQKICKSLYQKERKNFEYFNWECGVFDYNDEMTAELTLNGIKNKDKKWRADRFIRNLIVQIPIQIARGTGNQFLLMYNGADDQTEYQKGSIGSRSLCKAIRFSAYDGLIKSWEGKIKVVTSMGKQSTGKSYMLNHLFGTKFDISGGRCTDGAWLSARVVDDILFIICDFEGLGSFERSAQEDMLLATFNASISNCTIFKCDNRFDRSIEDMFNKFQSGVKIMKGSENCFAGALMLIIKDVIDTGAEAAVDDFERHIERLAQRAELVLNDKGKKESTFFISQMYKNGMAIIPYPPLANEAFFTELNETIEPTIDEMEPVLSGGKDFLDHIKLIMAKLNIGDYAAMSGEQAKIRATEIRENLQNGVEAGAIIQPKNTEYGVTFQVDDDQNLLQLDGNKVIRIAAKETIPQIKNYKDIIDGYSSTDANIEQILTDMVESINDAGIILGKVESLKFLWQQFSTKIKRVHANFKQITDLFQVFLDMIYWRRNLRVNKYIIDNTKKFEKKDKVEIDGLIQSAESRLNIIRDKMRICKSKCDDCFYPCLLCKNHEDDNDWDDEHTCYQIKHLCKEYCTYCFADGKSIQCGFKCGHAGKHNCLIENHTCGDTCSLNEYGGCQEKCNLESGHDKVAEPCKCSANTHYCKEKCAVGICKNKCCIPYNQDHTQHICIQNNCPYKCTCKCWNDALGQVADCGRPCSSSNHAHEIDMNSGDCKDEGHICDKEHPCPELCEEDGLCHVEVTKVLKKDTLITGAGKKIVYDSYAEVNGQTKRCCRKIPIGEFKHDGGAHVCYDKEKEIKKHFCKETCGACGYYCELAYGHYEKDGSFHECTHGNMRNTTFYATEDEVDTGDGRVYRFGDKGVAEMCHLNCQRLGRGHTHLEFCKYHLKGQKCVEEEGQRHQLKPYKPDEHKEKDEIQHSKFWRRKKWKDPCLKEMIKAFGKCPFVCADPSHEKRKDDKKDDKKDDEEEEDKIKYCTRDLWHKVCDPKNGCKCGKCHKFKCVHPFSKAHVIFVGDCSVSMTDTDGGKSKPQLDFIRNHPSGGHRGLNNRLGALYEAIYKFNECRAQKNCQDTCSVVMFESNAHVVVNRVKADKDFVKDHVLSWKVVWGGTNFQRGFSKARDLVKYDEETVMIFLTDGSAGDGGASTIVRDLKNQMKDKFSLYCITLASSTSSALSTICNAGKGKPIDNITGIKLGSTFINIAKTLGKGGGFM